MAVRVRRYKVTKSKQLDDASIRAKAFDANMKHFKIADATDTEPFK